MSYPYTLDIHRLWICLCFSCLNPLCLSAVETTVSECDLEKTIFPSVVFAVKKLSRCYHARSYREDREYIAAILEENGAYTVFVQVGVQGRDDVSIKVRRRKSQTINSFWHTHGAPGSHRERYSSTDSKTVRATGLPFYLVTPAGTIKVLGQIKSNGTLSRVTQGWNSGTIIGSL